MIPKNTGIPADGRDRAQVLFLDLVVREDLELPNMIATLIWRSLGFILIFAVFKLMTFLQQLEVNLYSFYIFRFQRSAQILHHVPRSNFVITS
jgi:hypothetical protein